jgi:hypothetical protein
VAKAARKGGVNSVVVQQPVVADVIHQQHSSGTRGSGTASAQTVHHAPASNSPPQERSSRQSTLTFMDTCTKGQAELINAAICLFIVGCGLSFNLAENPFFIQLLMSLRPAFVRFLHTRCWFSRNGMSDLYDNVKARIQVGFNKNAVTKFDTLGGVGFKIEAGAKVVNFTQQRGNQVAFLTSVAVGEEREDANFYVEHFKSQLTRDGIVPGTKESTWSAVVADNVGYMRNAMHNLEIAFPLLLCYGCVAHLLHLLCEDYAKLLDQVIDDAIFIVVFVTSHERLRQMFLRFKGPTGIGLRTLPDTCLSYAALMLRSVLDNCMNLRELLDKKHEAEYKEATINKNGTRVAHIQRFRELIGNCCK